jgi:hypothetical protein
VVGVDDILYDLGGTTITTYAWGLNIVSNNLAKVYALLRGIQLDKELRIIHLIILGESLVIISAGMI